MLATTHPLEVSTSCWWQLPLELQHMIFAFLIETTEQQANDPEREHTLSVYASVCSEWQSFFEPLNFRHPILHQDDIETFNKIVRNHRQTLVEWVWLRLELPEYGCKLCDNDSWPTETLNNDILFTSAIYDLFEVLATWSKGEDHSTGRKGLTLELSAHSPSDSKHWFKELTRRVNDTAWSRGPQDTINNCHGWKMGQQFRKPDFESKMRVFGNPKGLGFNERATSERPGKENLAEVTVVKSFIIRRQFYRCFSVTRALEPIIRHLSKLESFSYETWRGISEGSMFSVRDIRDNEHKALFSHVLKQSKAVKKLSVFEDYSQVYHPMNARAPRQRLGRNLARSSHRLEEIHAGFIADAQDFFYVALKPEAEEWKRLERLSLTTHALDYHRSNSLIQNAADAARKMPRLEVMELWHGDTKRASIFRYERRTDQPRIQLLTTWGGRLELQARKKWEDLARWQTSSDDSELLVETIQLQADHFKSHASVIPHLVLKGRLLNETSLKQIEMEDDWPDLH